jgi:hypothetical protein
MRRLAIIVLGTLLLVPPQSAGAKPEDAAVATLDPDGILVDMAGNEVIEPGEIFGLAPIWHNGSGGDVDVTGTLTNATGPAGGTYTILNDSADYDVIPNGGKGSCWDRPQLDCYLVQVNDPNPRPATHWHMTVTETLSTGDVKTWDLHIGRSFADNSPTATNYRFVETIFHNGITAGCNKKTPPWFCPSQSVTREQMAVFLLLSKEGSGYAPPPVGTPTFADVPATSPYAPWIEELVRRGVTAGCATNPRRYCPTKVVTRQEMAIFLLKTLEGGSYSPPPVGSPTFTDVPASSPYAPWIEDLFDRFIVAGCDSSPPRYCPTDPVSRRAMSVFLKRAFNLILYGP